MLEKWELSCFNLIGFKLLVSRHSLGGQLTFMDQVIFENRWRGRRHGVRPRGGGGVGGEEDLKVQHAVHLP